MTSDPAHSGPDGGASPRRERADSEPADPGRTGAERAGPERDCARCPRLVAFRAEARAAHPDWHNAPVPAFGPLSADILVVGLAPGLRGANRTGRPFTGDFAGDLLYARLIAAGLMSGSYQARVDDGVRPLRVRITNAVRCVPPENRPTPAEQAGCRPFLVAELAAMPRLRGLFALGRVAHEAVLRALGLRLAAHPFAHGALHRLDGGLLLADSYHCSRYNQNTGRLTEAMFAAALDTLVAAVASSSPTPPG